MCDLPKCKQQLDLRARQCSRFSDGQISRISLLEDRNDTWLPYVHFDDSPSCQLTCYNKEGDEIFQTGLDVEDGTPCSYESTDICVDVRD